jgi:hypothetical protein
MAPAVAVGCVPGAEIGGEEAGAEIGGPSLAGGDASTLPVAAGPVVPPQPAIERQAATAKEMARRSTRSA